jgi:diguanylate cyclase (GGDEF)-like protein/PAS domain S-box-containing protein
MSGLWTWDPETGAVTWSASVPGLFGVRETAATYPELLDAIHPRDRERLDRDWHRMVEAGMAGRQVFRSVTGQALTSQAQQVTVQGRSLVVGVFRQTRSHPEEGRFAEIFRAFPVGVALLTDEGFFLEVNDALCGLLGYPREDLVGTPFARLVHPDELEAAQDVRLRVVGRGETRARSERRLVRSDGTVVWVLINTRRYEEDGTAFSVSVIEDITARRAAEDQLVALALHDSLTGLPNRRLLLDRLEQALARSRRDGRDVAVLFVDLDHVKQVNDALGHEAGDELLITAAKNLQSVVRETDTVARLGGDEFVVVVERAAGLPELETLAERMLEAVRIPVSLGPDHLVVTASVGLVTPTSAQDRPQDLLRAADAAMYQAKQAGRGRFVIGAATAGRASDEDEDAERRALETQVGRALDRHELVLHYQPIVAMDGAVLEMEALLRWRHPERGMLLPEEFLPAPGQSVLTVSVTSWVLHQALSDASTWGETGPGIRVAVPVDLLRDGAFAEEVLALLALHEVAPQRLVVQLAEGQLAQTDMVQAAVARLHDAGVRFSVDGFGTGNASLGYFKQLPIESVKVDRSFIATVCDDPADASIVKAVVDACHATARTTIAEGVESSAQLRTLHALGCDAVQGALVATASPTELLDDILLTGHVPLRY